MTTRDIGLPNSHEPGSGDVPQPSPLAADGYRDDAHAVLIGINRYRHPGIRDLAFARADAEAVQHVLTDPCVGRFRPSNVRLLRDAEATRDQIREELHDLLPERVTSNDTVMIYFAGHGAPALNRTTRSRDGKEKYLVPHDAVPDRLRSTAIPMEEIQRCFEYIEARQVFFFIDSCYSGAGGRSFDPPGFQTRSFLSDEFLAGLSSESRVVVTACGIDEVSLESREKEHGLFTYYLVEGLKGKADEDNDGLVTFDELYKYVYANVERDSRLAGRVMRPLRRGATRGTTYLTQYRATGGGDSRTSGSESEQMTSPRQPDGGSDAKQQTSRLLDLVRSGALSHEHFLQATRILAASPNAQSQTDRRIRTLLDALLDGRLTAADYEYVVGRVTSRDTQTPERKQDQDDERSDPHSTTPPSGLLRAAWQNTAIRCVLIALIGIASAGLVVAILSAATEAPERASAWLAGRPSAGSQVIWVATIGVAIVAVLGLSLSITFRFSYPQRERRIIQMLVGMPGTVQWSRWAFVAGIYAGLFLAAAELLTGWAGFAFPDVAQRGLAFLTYTAALGWRVADVEGDIGASLYLGWGLGEYRR